MGESLPRAERRPRRPVAVVSVPPRLASMNRIKPLLVAGAIAAAVISFIRLRLSEDQPVDPGGWKPVDPA